MICIFEVRDKTKRKIRLTKKQWNHIIKRHSYMKKYLEEIKETLNTPDKLIIYNQDKSYYYKHYKYFKLPNHFILVIVKYLNGEGFVITAYLVEKIR